MEGLQLTDDSSAMVKAVVTAVPSYVGEVMVMTEPTSQVQCVAATGLEADRRHGSLQRWLLASWAAPARSQELVAEDLTEFRGKRTPVLQAYRRPAPDLTTHQPTTSTIFRPDVSILSHYIIR